MFLDVLDARIKTYYDDPTEMIESCALDIAEKYKGMRLEDIAEYLNLSRERVRQIQDQALRKIMLSGE
jgi:DNA-directed RNA polymerase specialized sigma subunit